MCIERDAKKQNEILSSLKELPKRIIIAQEEERNRIAQEIHDNFGQSLIALKLFIGSTIYSFMKKDPQVKKVCNNVIKQINGIIENARNLSHKLSPPSLKYIGLTIALKKLIKTITYNNKKLEIKFIHRNIAKISLQSRDIIIYRIVQEALLNIVKHSKATKVTIKSLYKKNIFSLEITDNGIGFNQKQVKKKDGIGLDLMKERAELVNGDLCIYSSEKSGTIIKLHIPIQENEKHA